LTIPDAEPVLDEQTAADLRREREEAIADNFLHIVCFLCYPAFAEKSVAPHDAECICGKPVHAGDTPGPLSAPSCVLCTEMAEGHYRKVHAKR
jgi:hypothetical protein